MIAIKRQIIRDTAGEAIGVLLPIEEFTLIEDILVQRSGTTLSDEEKLLKLEQAIHDPRYMSDLGEVMSAFAFVDQEFWEPIE